MKLLQCLVIAPESINELDVLVELGDVHCISKPQVTFYSSLEQRLVITEVMNRSKLC